MLQIGLVSGFSRTNQKGFTKFREWLAQRIPRDNACGAQFIADSRYRHVQRQYGLMKKVTAEATPDTLEVGKQPEQAFHVGMASHGNPAQALGPEQRQVNRRRSDREALVCTDIGSRLAASDVLFASSEKLLKN